jgi:hydrogenase maturation protein HypF
MPEIRSANIHITGIVQGVGFRPFVYGLATQFGLTGWVRNTSSGVDIEVDGTNDGLENFVNSLRLHLPPLARIDTFEITYQAPRNYSRFEIIESEAVAGAFLPISPDVSICPDCLGELFDPTNRRYLYPFINCTNCGPRFTIITDIPYDRPNTTMAEFEICDDCRAEYTNPLDRRFHAQPVACPVCGPQVWLEDAAGNKLSEGADAILDLQVLISDGKIVAIKGLGGFHLACDATNAEAVAELRHRKLRVEKPFALMMPDLATAEEHCWIEKTECELLESHQRPIVLLRRKAESPIVKDVAPGQDHLAVMLPYTPIHYLLFSSKTAGKPGVSKIPPLVMTSGNLSEEPIAIKNDEARQRLSSLADAFLMHNREIQTRCDDSVVRIARTNVENASIYFLRRSRGYAPDPIRLPFDVPPTLAVGPELKNTFCLTRERYAFISHHIGDMENYETLRSFEGAINDYEHIFRIEPKVIGCDVHPDYLSSRYAVQRSLMNDLPLFRIQHHHAHIAACMADNGMEPGRRVIGLAFDGTGLGDDGAIWGGEFLTADYAGYERHYHLAYFPLPGGDAAIKRPARTALALLWSLGMEWDDRLEPVKDFCYEERQALRIQLERGLNTPQTSSMGRLFDAAAALAGIRQKVNYEAQAAMEFETALDTSEMDAYHFEINGFEVDLHAMLRAMIEDIYSGVSVSIISARFHNGLAGMAREVCTEMRRQTSINDVALSGGVWQNMALLNRTTSTLVDGGFKVYIHRQVPTNDGGISLGQALVTAAKFGL